MAQNKMRKRYQQEFTRLLKRANRAIAEDDLWLGRVEVRQISSRWEEFEDKSGGILHAVLRCIDKKTRQYKDYTIEYAPWLNTMNWRISMEILNTFFVEDLDVWKIGNPKEEIYDWTKTPIDEKALEHTKWRDLATSLYQLVPY